MTYCFAWKDGNAAYLIADTLQTQSVPASRDHTSFNQPQRQVASEKFVEEKVLKVEELKPGVAVALAGDIGLATVIIGFLREQLPTAETYTDLWAQVEATFGPFDPCRAVELLVVDAGHQEAPTIWEWSTVSGCEAQQYGASIGSLPQPLAEQVASFVLELMQYGGSPDANLLIGIGAVLLLAQHEDLIQVGVGGAMCGLRVDGGVTTWLEDYVSVLYDDQRSIQGMVSVHSREGTLFINSTYDDIGSVFFAKQHGIASVLIAEARAREWFERWAATLHNNATKNIAACQRWIFINLSRPLAVVLVAEPEAAQIRKQLGVAWSEGNVCFEFSDGMEQRLWGQAPSYPKLRIWEFRRR